ncbi:uncharacterized protein LOC116345957 [Contarinia nasturtii]|uniref:uncharacterized protein LOC116345957 n=1 Tax=Contarinia nasturtii TaxID=265458 RepID=UPI0012D3FDA1|nr:uncharacterized protein LOC116345957 [Contarinia nasturtii]
MTECRINQHLCRLCGCKNENGRSLNDPNNIELVSKIQETFSMLIGGNDPLPNKICIQCEQDVNVFYMRIKRFRTLQNKWRDEVQTFSPMDPYLDYEKYYNNEMEKIREKINMYLNEMENHNNVKDPLEADVECATPNEQNDDVNVTVEQSTNDTMTFEQRLLKRERERKSSQRRKRGLTGYIRSRKLKRKLQKRAKNTETVLNPASVHPIENCAIPRAEIPYKKYRNEMLEIMSQNEILESRTRVNRRASQPFNYKLLSAQPQMAPKKKPSLPESLTVKKEPITNHVLEVVKLNIKSQTPKIADDASVNIRPRQRRRINYSEELVDEALMYEQILLDKQNQQEKFKKSSPKKVQQQTNDYTKSIPSPGNLDSRLRLLEQRNEISITPLKSRMPTKDSGRSESRIPMSMKTEPLFNITSSVSVHIKPRLNEQTAANLQISNITSLVSGQRAMPSSKRRKISCPYCAKIFNNDKQLATHQTAHLKIQLHQLDMVKILSPKLRRGRMLNLEDEQYIRCVNCWQLHTTNKGILDHWNNGACMFFCTICGKSFHDNIKDLKPHFENEHGIKYRSMFLPTNIRQMAAKTTTTDIDEKVETAKKPELAKKSTTHTGKKPVKLTINPNALGEFQCKECSKSFKSHKAYRAHHTLVHGGKHYLINKKRSGTQKQKMIGETVINPMALINAPTKSGKHQKTLGKKLKKRTNEAVMKTIIRKAPKRPPPPISLTNPPPLQPARKVTEPKSIETLIKTSTSSLEAAVNHHNKEVSQDQTVSSTFLASSSICAEDDVQIKPELDLDQSIDEYSNSYIDTSVQSCNGWVHLSPQYDNVDVGWNQNMVDPYLDMSPRLKVKDLTDLQNPRQQCYPVDTQGYHQQQQPQQPPPLHQMQPLQSAQHTNSLYKDTQPLIMPSPNMTDLQIQNVQSYQPQPPPQTYVEYSCVNNMNSSMNLPGHGMCTSNLYEMHISPAPQVQSTQLINPVFLLPSNSSHAVQDYHY